MAIEYTLNLEQIVLDEKIITDVVQKMNILFESFQIINSQSKITYNFYDSLGFNIILIKQYKGNYNLIEANFIEDDFEFKQLLIFEFNKKSELHICIKNAMLIILKLMKKLDSRALLNASTFIEVCFFNNYNSIIINSTLEIWSDEEVIHELKFWNVGIH